MKKLTSIQSVTLNSLAGRVSPEAYAIAANQVVTKAESYGQPLSALYPLASGELPTVQNLPREILEELVDSLAYAVLWRDLGGVDVTENIVAAIRAVDGGMGG